MKKTRYIVVPLVILCLLLSCFLVACKKALETPGDVSVDTETYEVSWSRVDNAKSYEVEVASVDGDYRETITVKRSRVSTTITYLDVGDYSVRVRAVAREDGDWANSAWSEAVYFTKEYFSGCTYKLVNNNTEYEITGWTRPSGEDTSDVVIKETYNGKPVVGIGDSAFKNKSTLTSLTVEGENLRYVGKNAFYQCTRLTSISLPDSVTEIGSGAFHSCGVLEKFTVPAGVETIEDSTFLYCRNLGEVDLSSVETIGETAFYGCNKALKNLVIPDTVKTVGEKAFGLCSLLETVEMGSGIETIGEYAFQSDSALASVKFKEDPETGLSSLRELGEYSFSGCSALEEVVLPQGVETIGDYAFYNDSALARVNIPETVQKIGYGAFGKTYLYTSQSDEPIVYVGKDYAEGLDENENKLWILGYHSTPLYNLAAESQTLTSEMFDLTTAMFDEDTVGIADEAFYGIKNVNRLTVPSFIQYIGDYSFYSSSFWQVTFEGGAQSGGVPSVYIGSYAFAKMTSLSSLNFASSANYSGVVGIGDRAFYGCSGLGATFAFPSSLETVGAYAFNNTAIEADEDGVMYAGTNSSGGYKWVVGRDVDTLAQTLTLDTDTYGIADYGFTRATDLISVANLDSVTKIGEGAFYKCESLVDAYLSRSITTIKPYTFYGCSSLTAVGDGVYTTFSSLEEIGRSAFYGCAALTNFSMRGSKVSHIGPYAFYKCESLTSIDLTAVESDSLETIDDYAFYRSGLESVVVPSSVTYIGEKAFYKCTNLANVEIENGDGEVEIGNYCFYKCSSLENINLPGSVVSVGDYAFYKCNAATSLSLGEGLRRIGSGTFAGLAIKTLKIPSTVEYIGSYAFKSCSNLTSVVIPGSVVEIGDHAFYGINGATFYTDAESIPGMWSVKFNSSYRPMVWGCDLSEDGDYVVSVTVGTSLVENVVKGTETTYDRTCGDPEREGYVFLGWSTSSDGSDGLIDMDLDEALATLPEGTVLYSVWEYIGFQGTGDSGDFDGDEDIDDENIWDGSELGEGGGTGTTSV